MILALAVLHLPRPAQATACTDFEHGASTRARACPLPPRPARPLRAPPPPRAAPRSGPVGPLQAAAVGPDLLSLWPVGRRPQAGAGPRGDLRSLVESDREARDCYGSLCGPQSITLRVGLASQEGRPSTFSPMIGGLGAVVGAIALTLKPGPPPKPAPGPSREGWAPVPRGLTPAAAPVRILPLISILNRQGGIQLLVSW